MSAVTYARFELLRTFRNGRFFIFSLAFPLIMYFLIAGPNEGARRKIYEQLVANAEKIKFNDRFEQPLSPPASKRLPEVKTPTLILVGEADIADVHTHCGEITAGIRGSTREVIKDAGHLIQLEKPEEVVKKLEDFVKRCEANRR